MVLATLKTDLRIRAEPLTPETFKPFGGVVSSGHQLSTLKAESANYGTATKLFKVSPIENTYSKCPSGSPATANWNLFRCSPPDHLIDPKPSSNTDTKLEAQTHPATVYEYTSKVLERHPFSTQTFIPMGRDKSDIAYMVIVAPTGPDGLPELSGVKAFLAKGNQAVTYGLATWHAPMIALGETVDFAVLIHENGVPDEDVEETYLETLKVDFQVTADADQSGLVEGIAALSTATANANGRPAKPKRRKSQSEEDYNAQLEEFHREGPVIQNHDFFDSSDRAAPSAKIDLNRTKYAAERQYYLGHYAEAAEIIENSIGSTKGKLTQEYQTILDASRAKLAQKN